MSKSKILAEVEAIVFARLFGGGPWLTDREIKRHRQGEIIRALGTSEQRAE